MTFFGSVGKGLKWAFGEFGTALAADVTYGALSGGASPAAAPTAGGKRGKGFVSSPPPKPTPLQRIMASVADSLERRKEMRVVFFRILLRMEDSKKNNILRRLREAEAGTGRWMEDTLVYLLGRATTKIVNDKVVSMRKEDVFSSDEGKLVVPGDGISSEEMIEKLNSLSDEDFATAMYTLESDGLGQHAERVWKRLGDLGQKAIPELEKFRDWLATQGVRR